MVTNLPVLKDGGGVKLLWADCVLLLWNEWWRMG